MQDSSSSAKTSFPRVNKHNLLLKIWTVPQETLEFILANCPDKYLTVLLIMGGTARALGRVISQHSTKKTGVSNGLTLGILFGTLSGWLTYYYYAWGLSLTGSWLGGKADTAQLRTVLAWALVPSITSLFFLLPQVAVIEDDSFRREYVTYFTGDSKMLLLCWIAQLFLNTWSVVLLIKGIALVQDFGFGKSVLNMLLPGTLIVLFILLIASLF